MKQHFKCLKNVPTILRRSENLPYLLSCPSSVVLVDLNESFRYEGKYFNELQNLVMK